MTENRTHTPDTERILGVLDKSMYEPTLLPTQEVREHWWRKMDWDDAVDALRMGKVVVVRCRQEERLAVETALMFWCTFPLVSKHDFENSKLTVMAKPCSQPAAAKHTLDREALLPEGQTMDNPLGLTVGQVGVPKYEAHNVGDIALVDPSERLDLIDFDSIYDDCASGKAVAIDIEPQEAEALRNRVVESLRSDRNDPWVINEVHSRYDRRNRRLWVWMGGRSPWTGKVLADSIG